MSCASVMAEAMVSASAWYICAGVRSSVIAAMAYCNGLALWLLQFLQQFGEPFCFRIKCLAALDAGEFDGAEEIVSCLIVAHHAAFAFQAAFHGVLHHGPDKNQVFLVGGGGPGKITRLLHQD